MKSLKKILAVALALAMVMAFAACGQKEEEPAAEDTGFKTVEAGKLTMATECTFPPYEFYDGDKIVGIDVEIAQAIGEKLGLEVEIIDTAFDSIIPSIISGKYDIALAGMTVTEERLTQVNFSDTYATGVQVLIVPEDSEITSVDDLFEEGAYTVIGTQTGTTGDLYATWDIADAGLGETLPFQKTTDAMQALLDGKCQCILLDNEPAKALVEGNPGTKILDSEYAVEDYAIAVSKDNEPLLEAVNGALKELIADGTVQSILDTYIK